MSKNNQTQEPEIELTEEEQREQLSEILKVRREKLDNLRAENRDPFMITKFEVTHNTSEIRENFEALENQTVTIAGRMMSKRGMGKASFCDLLDQQGRIQMYVRVDELGVEEYDRFKKLDIGDIIGATGFVFRTKRGEISVHVQEVTLLSKSLQPLLCKDTFLDHCTAIFQCKRM